MSRQTRSLPIRRSFLHWQASVSRLRVAAWAGCGLLAGAAILPQAQAANDAWSTSPTDGTFTGTNWTTGTTTPGAPTGTVSSGDSLYFGTSSITTLNENEAVGFSFGGFTFNAGASAFTIGGNSFALGTGGITNNSTSLQTINDAFTMAPTDTFTTTAGGGDLLLGGAISGAGGVIKAGLGTLTLSGALSYTGATTVNAGTLTITGTGTGLGVFSVAPTSSATLNLASTGTLALGANDFLLGVTSQAANNNAIASNGVVNQTTGTVTQGTGNQIVLASGSTSAFAGYNLSGGTLNVGTVRAGGVGNAAEGNSLFTQTGGIFTSTNYFLGRNSSGINQIYINGAGASFTVPLTLGYAGSGTAVATVGAGNVTDSGILYLGATSFTGTAILNLDGGMVSATQLLRQAGSSIVNFNGGTLRANTGSQSAFLTGLTSANVYAGGAKIDTNGQTITIGQNLLTTGGTTGVMTIPVTNGGSYLSAPLVSITGGGGTGATAVANLTNGVVTSITITNPGTGYTGTPAVTLIGGGATTAATLGTAAIGANAATDGGLTKIGLGNLTLSGANTFNGNVAVNAGTLTVGVMGANNGSTGALGLSNAGKTITVSSGATLTGTVANWFGNASNTGTLPTITLNGGTLSTTRYTTIGALNLNGATVTASATDTGNSTSTYEAFALRGNVTVSGTTASTISSTNVTTTTGGYHLGANTTFNVADVTGDVNPDLTISAPLINQSGDFGNAAGGLTKTGAGTLLLSGANTYTGATAVNAGILYVNGSLNTASAVSVASGARLGGTGTVGTATVASGGSVEGGQSNAGKLTLSGLTFSGSGTAFFGNLSNYTTSPAIAAGALTANGGANSVSLTINGAIPGVGTYELFSYTGSIGGTGATAFTLATPLPNRATGALDFSHAGLIDLTVTGTDFLIWTGATTNTWDTTNQNWKLNSNGAATTYIDNPGDSVVFDDSAGSAHTTVSLNSGDLHPTAVTFNNNTLNYLLQGTNAIAGLTGLTMNGTGTVTITNANTYSGVTTINAGTLQLGNAGTTGSISASGAITDNATLVINRSNAVTQGTDFGPGITGSGSLTQAGTGTLTLSGTNAYTGGTTVNAGTTLVLNGGGTGAGTVQGTVNVGTGATLNLNSNNALGMGTGSVATVNVNGGTVTSTAGNSEGFLTSFNLIGGTVAAGSQFRFNVNAATPPTISSSANGTTATFAAAIDDVENSSTAGNLAVNVASGFTTSGTDLTISGLISDNGGLTKNGSGYLNLTAQNTFTGPVNVTAGTLNVGVGGTGTASALGADSTTKAVTVSSGATLFGTINNWFGTGTQSSGGVSTLPTITLNGGTLSTTRYTAIGALNLNGGTVTATSADMNATFQAFALTGDVTVGGTTSSTITSTNVGTNAGGYHLGNNAAKNTTFTVASTGGTGPDLTVSAPLINQSGDFGGGAAGFTKAGAGTMLLTATNTYTGPTAVTAGSLLVTGSTAVGSAVMVTNSGTLLGGIGTIGGTVNVGNGSIISAGNPTSSTTPTGILTTGALTLNTGSTFNALLTSNSSFSTLSAAGTTTLSNAAFSITTTPGATFNSGSTLELITSSVTGMFTNTSYTAGGYNFTADYTTNSGFFDVDISSVPELATWIYGFGMVGLLGVSQRRRVGGWLRASRG